jgi:hypothetical protein
MFTKYENEARLDREIARLLDLLPTADTDEYDKTMNDVERLSKLKEKNSVRWPSPDTMLLVASNLIGIAMIIKHEHTGNFISSKALGFVNKPK